MYISIGPLITIKKEDIVGIFDLDTAAATKATKDFLVSCEKKGGTVSALSPGELPKSFILTRSGKVYFSQYAARILRIRAKKLKNLFLKKCS